MDEAARARRFIKPEATESQFIPSNSTEFAKETLVNFRLVDSQQEYTMTDVNLRASTSTLGYYRSASTGAFSTLIIFALCWAGVALGLPLTLPHGFVSLFTLQPVGSATALLIGGLFAFLAGGIAGVIIAHCYNLAGRWFGD